MRMRNLHVGKVLFAAALVAGCQSGDDPSDIDPDSAPQVAPGTSGTAVAAPLEQVLLTHEVDASALHERLELALQPSRDGFAGGFVTHAVTTRAGVIDFMPGKAGTQGDGLTLETIAIRRGDYIIDATASGTSRAADGAIETLRSEVVERLTNSARGIEQSWVFGEEPGTEGDLEVVVDVGTSGLITANATGLHFGAPGKVGSRYSHATWIDANGNEAEVPVQFVAGQIRINVSHDLLANAAYPAVLDPTVTAETAVDAPVAGGTNANSRTPSVAIAGGQTLTVWADDRDEGSLANIYAVRTSSAGAVLDSTAIQLDTTAGVQAAPVVAALGSGYLAVWENGSGGLKGATISSGGAVTSLGTVAATGAEPTLAARGSDVLLAYRTADDISAKIFSGGSFGGAIAVAATAAIEQQPAVAADPAGDYLVTWSDGAAALDLKGQLVTSAGALSGAAITVSAATGTQSEASASFAGGNFIVLWTNNKAGIDIYGTRVSPAGVVLDTRLDGAATVGGIGIVTAAENQNLGEVACASGGCVLTWKDRRNLATNGNDVYGLAITTALAASGSEFVIGGATNEQGQPALATDGTDYFAAWQDQRSNGAYQIYGSRISGAGAVLDASGIFLSLGTNAEKAPAVVNGTSTWFTAWSDSRDAAGADIVGVRVANNGNVQDATAKTVSNAAKQQQTPRLAASASEYLAVWSDGRGADFDIYARRVDPATGNTLGTETAISTATADQFLPVVASNGTTYLVVWQDKRTAANNFDIYGALVAANGTVSVADIGIYTGTGEQNSPAVAWDPTAGQYVVVWSDARGGAGTNDIYGTRVSAAGAVLDAGGVVISAGAQAQLAPAIATGVSGQLLVAWDDRRNANGDIFVGRITAGASLARLDADGVAFAVVAGSKQTSPAATYVGSSYVVVWTDERALASNGRDLYGKAMSAIGVLGAEFAVSVTTNDEANPTLASPPTATGNGYGLLAYDRFEPALDARRVFFRRVKADGAGGGTCSTAAQCESGFCVDGKCCDQACGGNSQTDCQACSKARGAAVDGTCAPVQPGRICRNYADNYCDLREVCDGVQTACPDDLGRRQGNSCSIAGGGTGACPANAAVGAPHVCQ